MPKATAFADRGRDDVARGGGEGAGTHGREGRAVRTQHAGAGTRDAVRGDRGGLRARRCRWGWCSAPIKTDDGGLRASRGQADQRGFDEVAGAEGDAARAAHPGAPGTADPPATSRRSGNRPRSTTCGRSCRRRSDGRLSRPANGARQAADGAVKRERPTYHCQRMKRALRCSQGPLDFVAIAQLAVVSWTFPVDSCLVRGRATPLQC